MSTVFTGTIARALKETLEEIVTDGGYQSKAIYKKWLVEMNMKMIDAAVEYVASHPVAVPQEAGAR